MKGRRQNKVELKKTNKLFNNLFYSSPALASRFFANCATYFIHQTSLKWFLVSSKRSNVLSKSQDQLTLWLASYSGKV